MAPERPSLGYTQPAISYQMRCLEHAVGAALAVRVGRTMALTAAGQALLPHADRILASIRAAEQEVSLLIGAHRRMSCGSRRFQACVPPWYPPRWPTAAETCQP